jgi:ADP-heptose:LPS heptosyltransferase
VSVERIVVVNFTRMGDLIQSGPLMRTLKTAHPHATLTTVVFNAFRDVAERLPMVDEVLAFDVDRIVPQLDARRGNLASVYDEVQAFLRDSRLQNAELLYNLAHTPQSATLCALMEPRLARGHIRGRDGQIKVVGEWFNYLFSVMQDRTYNPFNLVEIYLRTHDKCTEFSPLELRVTDDDRQQAAHLLAAIGIQWSDRCVVLQPGASSPSRQWPPAYFAELAKRLNDSGLRSIIVGSAEEAALAEQIAHLSQQTAASLTGQTNVGTLAAVLEGAHKLVSNDTGTIHLAAAVGTPTIGIYLGPASAKDTAPYGNGHVIVEADLSCAPCGYHSECSAFSCHRRVTVDSVHRLCMIDARQTEMIARQLSGIRVFKTHIAPDGKFTLEQMNQSATGYNFMLLEFYRAFWDRLLLNGDALKPMKLPPIDGLPEWQTGIERLREILERAERWLFALLGELQKPAVNAALVADLLRGGEHWKNDLRKFTDDLPLLSPLSRYLLVRLQSVRSGELSDHLEDMTEIIAIFENAVALLGSTTVEKTAWRERAAVA